MSVPKFFKITNKDENHHGFQYHDGLNVLIDKFNPRGHCVKGGFYFTDINNILEFLSLGIYLRLITLPTDDSEFKMVADSDDKWRANKIILGKRFNLSDPKTFEYLETLGANIAVYAYDIFEHAYQNEFFDIIIYLYKKKYISMERVIFMYNPNNESWRGLFLRAIIKRCMDIAMLFFDAKYNIKFKNNLALITAVKCNSFNIAQSLVEHDCNVKARNNLALMMAVINGDLKMTNFLIRSGCNVKAQNNRALIIAVNKNDLVMVHFLLKSGCNPKARKNMAFRIARKQNNQEILDTLEYYN